MTDPDVREVVDDHELRLAVVEAEQTSIGLTVARTEGKVDALLMMKGVNPKVVINQNPGEPLEHDEMKKALRWPEIVKLLRIAATVLLALAGMVGSQAYFGW